MVIVVPSSHGLCTHPGRPWFLQINLGNKDTCNPSLSLSQALQILFWCISHRGLHPEGRVVTAIVGQRPGAGCGRDATSRSWAAQHVSVCVHAFSASVPFHRPRSLRGALPGPVYGCPLVACQLESLRPENRQGAGKV